MSRNSNRKKRNSIFNPPRGVQVNAGDMEMLDRLSEAYEQDVEAGKMEEEVVEPEIIEPGPTVDGFLEYVKDEVIVPLENFVENDPYTKTKEFIGGEVSEFVDFAGRNIGNLENKVLPNPVTAISGLGVIAFMAALGLIVAAKHL
jgi:hypothetical protein